MINKKHILLHLQDARHCIDIKDWAQVEFNIYEIGEHLGFSPKDINKYINNKKETK